MARVKLPDDHPARVHMDKAAESATPASDLTRPLLAYAGKGRFEVTVLDLNQMTHETLALVDATLPPKSSYCSSQALKRGQLKRIMDRSSR